MLSAMCTTEKSWKEESVQQTSLSSYFLKLPQPPQPFSNHHPDPSAAMNVKARPSTSKEFILTKGSGDSIF